MVGFVSKRQRIVETNVSGSHGFNRSQNRLCLLFYFRPVDLSSHRCLPVSGK